MKFMLLIYGDEQARQKATPADIQKEGAAYEEFTKSIVASAFETGCGLGRRRSRRGRFPTIISPTIPSTTSAASGASSTQRQGPRAADTAKLQLQAYYKVEAKSPEEAVEMASRIPGAQRGTIEVRPVWEFN